ncbi:FtsL-like putative cell division protein [uncultured Odoribacter sp.]|uniref:FtsL-like putative cell division protein n=1 Tax=uncultured Odoribacter sp. TaxID=876416 RepID=UPI00263733D7|nr:FtsL-like putative cell division protein [uncultured Odoribacter sp.]
MKLFSKAKDFISPNEELKETLESSVKELLDGRILADKVIRKNIAFILFLTFLGIFYIANGYSTEKLYKQKVKMEREVRELRFESITTAARLMFISKQSEVKRRINEAGLDLQESKEPPLKLYKK